MTQDYEPIEITENTPEPEDYSLIFLSRIDRSESTVAESIEYGWTIPAHNGAFEWEQVRRAFKGWNMQTLAAHDAEVRDKALSLTDGELAIAEGAYESSVMEYEGDGLVVMSTALKAVAEDRRNHEHRSR